ncbi:hypothetical protein [Actinoplanes sp. NPDC026623]|uniref:hypothetical protein n=1 Tax=Actinoplanes sp. NPDC026623 TaxID=3155610 RepID=UPI0033E2D619
MITEISDVTRVRRDTPFVTRLRPVRSVVPAVEGAGVVDATSVFAAFARKVGPDAGRLGEESPREEAPGQWTLAASGAAVTYTSVQIVEASFTERCGDVAASGVVTSWDRSRSGIMQCDLKPQGTEDVVKEAVALAC